MSNDEYDVRTSPDGPTDIDYTVTLHLPAEEQEEAPLPEAFDIERAMAEICERIGLRIESVSVERQ